MLRLIAVLGLFLSLVLISGCGKDETPVLVGQPVVYPTFKVVTNDAKSSTVSVLISYSTENVKTGDVDGEPLTVPTGTFTVSMNRGDTKIFTFTAYNVDGIRSQKQFPVEVKKLAEPDLYVSASVTNLPKGGGKTKLTANATHANSITFNGIEYTNFPIEFETNWIDHDSIFTFIAKGDGGETTKSITITVVPPTEQELIIKGDAWTVSKLEGSFYNTNGQWTEFYDYIGNKMTFYISQPYPYKMKAENACGSGTCEYWYDWSLSGSLLSGFGDRTIVSLSEHQMVLIYESSSIRPGGDIPWFVRETYIR